MDIRDIYVIADNKTFSKEDIVRIIQVEGYKHNFFFGGVLDVAKMFASDEVWCFGECENHFEYDYAKTIGKDIWRMG